MAVDIREYMFSDYIRNTVDKKVFFTAFLFTNDSFEGFGEKLKY